MALALRLLLLIFMVAVVVLASNLDAFLFMNRYLWFRKVRNVTAFSFIFLGHLGASAIATLSGREDKPRPEEIHTATVVVIEVFTVGLLVSTLSALFSAIADGIGRRKLKHVEEEVEAVIAEVLKCVAGLNQLPLESSLSLTHLPEVPVHLDPTFEQAQSSEKAAEDRKQKVQQDTAKLQENLEKAQTGLKALEDLGERLDKAELICGALDVRYSVFSKQRYSRDLQQLRALISKTAFDVANRIVNFTRLCEIYASWIQKSIKRLQAAQDVLDLAGKAVRKCEQRAINASRMLEDARRKDATQQQLPRPSRTPRVKAVLLCLLFASLLIAIKHSDLSSPTPKTTSQSQLTQLALLENYLQTSEFSNYILVVFLETVGQCPGFIGLPPFHLAAAPAWIDRRQLAHSYPQVSSPLLFISSAINDRAQQAS
jgi:hypothetical protein